MSLIRLKGLASGEKGKQRILIDWRPEMRLWPDSDYPVLDIIEGIEGGKCGDLEYLANAQNYFIKLTEEVDDDETDSRIDS